jgi:RNA polymerase sigma-70 factor (ECF subfamily)
MGCAQRPIASINVTVAHLRSKYLKGTRQNHERNNQLNVMHIYESAVLRRGSFPCPSATVGVIVAAPSWLKRAERRVDHLQAQDAAADVRRTTWMAAAQTGDGAAYRALLRDCIPIIKSFARRRGIPADYLDDVVQETLLTVHRARQAYDPSRSFTAWLSTIADRRAIDLLRRIRRKDVREVHAPRAFENHADEAADPARGLTQAEVTGAFAHALAGLPPRQREAVQRLVLDERSLAEAAKLTHRTKGSLKVNLHRGLKALRDRISSRE